MLAIIPMNVAAIGFLVVGLALFLGGLLHARHRRRRFRRMADEVRERHRTGPWA